MESLKVIQTILLLVTTTEIVSGQHLAKVLHMSAVASPLHSNYCSIVYIAHAYTGSYPYTY